MAQGNFCQEAPKVRKQYVDLDPSQKKSLPEQAHRLYCEIMWCWIVFRNVRTDDPQAKNFEYRVHEPEPSI